MVHLINIPWSIANSFLAAWVFQMLWNWHMTDIGLERIGFWLAFGLLIVAGIPLLSLAVRQAVNAYTGEDEDERTLLASLGMSIVLPAALAVGAFTEVMK